jgi:1-acyl-sn-glycerol-3-phosphate acyltransferase
MDLQKTPADGAKSKVREQQVPMESVYPMTIGPSYRFIRYDPFYLFFSTIAYYLFYLVLGLGWFRLIGTQHSIGRGKLKPLRKQGYITVANHCHIFDTVLTGLALLPRLPWYASVQRNFEAPYFRKLFRILRGFPIPQGVFGLRRIMRPVTEAISRRRIVHFFPEEELWHLYQEIDHFQRGSFFLAHVAGCPVVPIVHLFRIRKFFGRELSKNILCITTVIGDPLYPDIPCPQGGIPDAGSVQRMTDKAQQWMKERVEEYHAGLVDALSQDVTGLP